MIIHKDLKKTCGKYLLFSRKIALTTIVMAEIFIVLFTGNSYPESN